MSQVIVTHNTLAARQRRIRSKNPISLKPLLVILTMGCIVSFLSVTMLIHFNKNATKGYTIKYLEVKQQELIEQNKIIKNELLEKQALLSLSQTEKAASMVKPRQVSYVTPHNTLAHHQ